MSSFTDRRTIKNCLMSARNMRAAAHAPCSQRALSMFTCPNLERKFDRFHVVHGIGGAVGGGWWMRGAELSRIFVLLTDLYKSAVPLRSLHNQKNKALLSWPLLIPFMTYEWILTTDGLISSYVRTSKSRRYRDISF